MDCVQHRAFLLGLSVTVPRDLLELQTFASECLPLFSSVEWDNDETDLTGTEEGGEGFATQGSRFFLSKIEEDVVEWIHD